MAETTGTNVRKGVDDAIMTGASFAVELDGAKIYTMQELNQNTARVIDEINRSGQTAAVTKHGRFVALITPMLNARVESLVLRKDTFVAELERRSSDSHQTTYSSQEVAERLMSHTNERTSDSD